MTPQRFLFEEDFTIPKSVSIPPASEDIKVEPDMQPEIPAEPVIVFDQAAYDDGYQKGYAAADAQFQTHIAEQASRYQALSHRIDAFINGTKSELSVLEAHIETTIDALILHFGELIDPVNILTQPQYGFTEILKSISQMTSLSISASPETIEKLEVHFSQTGATHKSKFISLPTIPDGDFEIAWQDGGVSFERSRIVEKYRAIISQYRNAHAASQIEDTAPITEHEERHDG